MSGPTCINVPHSLGTMGGGAGGGDGGGLGGGGGGEGGGGGGADGGASGGVTRLHWEYDVMPIAWHENAVTPSAQYVVEPLSMFTLSHSCQFEMQSGDGGGGGESCRLQ